MMTTEVMWGNDHLNQEEPKVQVSHKTAVFKTEGEKQTEAILAMAQLLHDAEQKIEELKQRVADLEDMLSSK